MEVQLHVDVRMRQKAGTQTTKIKSAKSFVMVHPRKFIPSKYTRYTVVRVRTWQFALGSSDLVVQTW